MGRTLPLTARNTDAPDGSDTALAVRLLHLCVEPERRTALETLCEEGALEVDSLAERVAARRQGRSVSEVSDDAVERIAIGLHHTHLHKLVEADLVERTEDGDGATVALSSLVEPDRVRELIRCGDGSWEAIDALLRHDRRRHVAAYLASTDGTITLDELAEAVAERERDAAGTPDRETVESVRVSLHHVHLPRLNDAGVLSYDVDGRLATAEPLPEVCGSIVADDAESVPA